jgi:hypothetical protein
MPIPCVYYVDSGHVGQCVLLVRSLGTERSGMRLGVLGGAFVFPLSALLQLLVRYLNIISLGTGLS